MLPANIRDASNSGRLLAHAVHRLAAANVARQQVRTLRAPRCSLLGLINGILDLSKIEAGKLELENYDFNLRELIEDVTYSFSEAAGEKGLELSCFISSNVPPAIVGDAGRLRQIFVNLISNALKFTERGEIVVEASLIEASASALKAVFAGSVMCDAAAASDQPVAVAAFSATDVLDESVLASLRQLQCAGRPDIVRRTIGLYMESAPQLLTELQEGAASGDVAALGRASHSLKSNSANVGAMKLAAQCNDLEKLARSGMLAEACALVREVLEDYAVAKAMLSEHLERAA